MLNQLLHDDLASDRRRSKLSRLGAAEAAFAHHARPLAELLLSRKYVHALVEQDRPVRGAARNLSRRPGSPGDVCRNPVRFSRSTE